MRLRVLTGGGDGIFRFAGKTAVTSAEFPQVVRKKQKNNCFLLKINCFILYLCYFTCFLYVASLAHLICVLNSFGAILLPADFKFEPIYPDTLRFL